MRKTPPGHTLVVFIKFIRTQWKDKSARGKIVLQSAAGLQNLPKNDSQGWPFTVTVCGEVVGLSEGSHNFCCVLNGR